MGYERDSNGNIRQSDGMAELPPSSLETCARTSEVMDRKREPVTIAALGLCREEIKPEGTEIEIYLPAETS